MTRLFVTSVPAGYFELPAEVNVALPAGLKSARSASHAMTAATEDFVAAEKGTVRLSPMTGDPDGLGVEAAGLGTLHERRDASGAALVDPAEPVHEELVADVAPAQRLRVVGVHAAQDRDGTCACV